MPHSLNLLLLSFLASSPSPVAAPGSPAVAASAAACTRFRPAALTLVFLGLGLTAAAAAPSPEPKDETIAALLSRLAALEQRVQRQEEELATLRRPGAARPAATPAPAAATTATPAPPLANIGDTADTWGESNAPMLTLRGFGDVQYRWRNGTANTNAFTVGQIDLFITSRITEELALLNENVVKVNSRGESEFEAERLLIRYAPSDYFNVSAGRYHTALGFYNTAYHHGSWFQTAVGRPLPYRPEEGGGILPIHNVGLSITGQLPWSGAGLSYTVEIGNGRDYRAGAQVQQSGDANDQKAINLALVTRPDALPGFQAGLNYYTDHPTTALGTSVQQNIFIAHAVYQRPWVEWLNEVVLMRNTPAGGRTFETWGFYSQFGRSFGALRPYLRYHLLEVARGDPVLATAATAGRTHGPTFGLRYNLSNFTAVKIQYDHLWIENAPTTSRDVTFQWAFTF